MEVGQMHVWTDLDDGDDTIIMNCKGGYYSISRICEMLIAMWNPSNFPGMDDVKTHYTDLDIAKQQVEQHRIAHNR